MLKKVVLITCDNVIKKHTKELLDFANYEVSLPKNSKEGLTTAVNLQPNLILCDLNLPSSKNGIDLFKRCIIHPKLKTIPFIFLTKSTSKSLVRKLMDLGVDDVISTPYKDIELLKVIKSRIRRAEAFINLPKINRYNLYDKSENLITLKNLESEVAQKKIYVFKAGETIYCKGNKSNHIFLIKKGTVKTYKTNSLGKEFITGFFSNEQYFGYSSFIKNTSHFENAKAITTTFLYKISKEEIIKAINKNCTILFNFMDVLANDLIKIKEQLMLQAYASVRKKTANTLLNFQKYYLLKKENAITINRTDLADSIGIAKETLTRTLHDFKDEKLISFTPKSITILDKNKLQQIL